MSFPFSNMCPPLDEHDPLMDENRWMAPEVIRHEPYGKPADVHSFGEFDNRSFTTKYCAIHTAHVSYLHPLFVESWYEIVLPSPSVR